MSERVDVLRERIRKARKARKNGEPCENVRKLLDKLKIATAK